MNNRIEIKIAVLGEPMAGKETFARMLFLDSDNTTKIRIEPLSKLATMYMEIDPVNFQHGSKKIISECREHNNLIMKQTQIDDLEQLRANKIEPFFYRHCNRILGMINFTDNQHINPNVLLTFYFIGNNYTDFMKEINDANILIYLADIGNTRITESYLFQTLVSTVINDNTKYMITLVNKCDNLNSDGDFVKITNNDILTFDKAIREKAQQYNIHNNLSPAIPISCKYASLYRQINFSIPHEIRPDDVAFISTQFSIKKEMVEKDIARNSNKYFKQSGYTAFKDYFVDILASRYRNMIDHNFSKSLQYLDPELNLLHANNLPFTDKVNLLHANNLPFTDKVNSSTEDFIIFLRQTKNQTTRLNKIFKKDYEQDIVKALKTVLDTIMKSNDPDMAVVDAIKEIYCDNPEIISMIENIKGKMYSKIINNIGNKLYANEITIDNFLPSKVHTLFDKMLGSYPPKDQTNRLALHICELYSSKARLLLDDCYNIHFNTLWDTYFIPDETRKMMSMLNEIKSMMNFDSYKLYLIQILLTKLLVVEKCVEYKENIGDEKIKTIMSYCKSLRYHLSDNAHRKYDYLFGNIYDICTQFIFNLGGINQIKYISENIEAIINFKPDRVIDLDKFIIKMIKKTNYEAVVADDEYDSDEDSDVDIYGLDDFHFTKDDLDSDDDSTHYSRRGKKLNADDEIEV